MGIEIAMSHERIAEKLFFSCFASALPVCPLGELIISFDEMIIDDKVPLKFLMPLHAFSVDFA